MGMALVLTGSLLAACSGGADPPVTESPQSPSVTPTVSASSGARAPDLGFDRADQQPVESAMEEVLAGGLVQHVAVAIAPVGPAPVSPIILSGHPEAGQPPAGGDGPEDLVAWSTIKVPLALAVIDRAGADSSTTSPGEDSSDAGVTTSDGSGIPEDLDPMLRASDNAAADRAWASLGDPRRAAAQVQAVLRSGGDRHSRVPSEVTVPGYSAFGQTEWALRDQAIFTARLPCLDGYREIAEPLTEVDPIQLWGVASLDGAVSKAGWGSTAEGYVVRQLAVLPAGRGQVAVSLQALAADHASAVSALDALAEALAEVIPTLEGGRCGG